MWQSFLTTVIKLFHICQKITFRLDTDTRNTRNEFFLFCQGIICVVYLPEKMFF